MKKIFALALAAVMATGMTSVAFAAGTDAQLALGQFVKGGSWTEDVAYVANADGVYNVLTNISTATEILPGKKVYIPIAYINDAAGNADNTIDANEVTEPTKEQMKGYKAMISYKVGKLDKAPTIEYVKYANADGATGANVNYGYAIVVEVPANTTPKSIDIAGEIVLAKTTTEQKAADAKRTTAFKCSVGRDVKDTTTTAYSGGDLTSDGAWVKFDTDATDIDISWGDNATYTVNVAGQDKLNLLSNTKYNSSVAALFPAANLDFITFTGAPTFNRTGMFYLNAENNKFVYEVTATGVKAIDAKYDEAYGAYAFKTRKLTSYVVSDKELDTTKVIETASTSSAATSSKPATEKPNPDTGR